MRLAFVLPWLAVSFAANVWGCAPSASAPTACWDAEVRVGTYEDAERHLLHVHENAPLPAPIVDGCGIARVEVVQSPLHTYRQPAWAVDVVLTREAARRLLARLDSIHTLAQADSGAALLARAGVRVASRDQGWWGWALRQPPFPTPMAPAPTFVYERDGETRVQPLWVFDEQEAHRLVREATLPDSLAP